jgi:hypothetical protein
MRNKIVFLTLLIFLYVSLAFCDNGVKEILPGSTSPKVSIIEDNSLSEGALVDTVLEISGAKKQLVNIQSQAVDAYSWYKDKLTPQLYDEGNRIIAQAYGSDKLYKSLSKYFMDNFNRARLLAVKQYCESPLAQRITDLEIKASSQEGFQELKNFGDGLASSPPAPQRLELIKKLDKETQATELQLETIVFNFETIAKAVDTLLPAEKRLGVGELSKISENMRLKLEPILDNGTCVYFLYTYKTLSEEELKEYLNFWVSEDGKWFVQTANGAYKFALAKAAEEIAANFAEIFTKIKQAETEPQAPRLRETSVPLNTGGK